MTAREKNPRADYVTHAYRNDTNGSSGYKENLQAARALNDDLVEKGDKQAINRKIEGLACGHCGYKKDLKAAKELNDSFIERGDQQAI